MQLTAGIARASSLAPLDRVPPAGQPRFDVYVRRRRRAGHGETAEVRAAQPPSRAKTIPAGRERIRLRLSDPAASRKQSARPRYRVGKRAAAPGWRVQRFLPAAARIETVASCHVPQQIART